MSDQQWNFRVFSLLLTITFKLFKSRYVMVLFVLYYVASYYSVVKSKKNWIRF